MKYIKFNKLNLLIFLKGYDFFSKNIGKEVSKVLYSKYKLLDQAKKFGRDALKLIQKE